MDGFTDAKGAPKPLQLVAVSRGFGDVVVPRKPPPAVQKVLFALLGPIAERRGYRATYPRYEELHFEGTPEDVRAGPGNHADLGRGRRTAGAGALDGDAPTAGPHS